MNSLDLNKNWQDLIFKKIDKNEFNSFLSFICKQYEEETIYPTKENIFRIYNSLKLENIKLVILGQDPYHDGSADGFAFSNKQQTKRISPSLKNIFRELEIEYGIKRTNPELHSWVEQGVFLLNTILTVKEHNPLSFQNTYWDLQFTKATIELIGQREEPCIFLLLGSKAQAYEKVISNPKHIIIKASHPSPLSAYRGFFNSNIFIKVNNALRELGKEEINFFK